MWQSPGVAKLSLSNLEAQRFAVWRPNIISSHGVEP